MKNSSLKSRVADLASSRFPEAEVEVRGTRVKGRFGGYFVAELNVDGNTLTRARHQDWRTAYKSLEIEFSRYWID